MENFPDKISPMTLAAAIALGSGGGGQPTGTVYYPAGSIPFLSLPALTLSRVGAVYDITDDFTSSSDFTDGGGKDYLAGTDVAIVNTGTAENPVLKYNCLTNAINEIVDQAKIGTSATGSDLTLSTSAGNLNALTVYGKSEVVDGSIKSAGEGWYVVDLGALSWSVYSQSTTGIDGSKAFIHVLDKPAKSILSGSSIFPAISNYKLDSYYNTVSFAEGSAGSNAICQNINGTAILIRVATINTGTDLQTYLSNNPITLAYQLADPTQGNCVAVKTDNGSGIDGTMAVFETGTPLYGVSNATRDVMTWDGTSGTVTKNANKVNALTLTWSRNEQYGTWISNSLRNLIKPSARDVLQSFMVTPLEYTGVSWTAFGADDKTYSVDRNGDIGFKDSDYDNTKPPDFDIIYELATPTTTPLTTAENASIAELRIFQPQTHVQNNAGTDMTIEAYAGTANGKAVNELKQDVQSEISKLKITQSGTLTLTTAGWTNNAQVIAYAHDTAKRNVIDVDPSSIEEWASCGILATAETASGITFTCKTVPTNALNFRVTSMGV